ncbi:MAG: hypothetical protein WCT24_01590 [Patescibacteria group bacterium]|jgi:hypothetical protein
MALRILKIIGLSLFFVSCFTTTFFVGHLANSPDESANYLFASQIANGNAMRFSEPLEASLGNLIHPRSMVAVGEFIVPGSFLGLPVLAGIMGIGWKDGVYLLTPLLAVLAILAWRSFVKNLFANELLADLSAFFLAIHPAFWYYAGRPMMHNVGFLAFLIFAVWAIGVRPIKEKWTILNFVLGGVCLAWALAFRTAEAVWVLPIALAILAVIWKKHVISWKQLLGVVVGFVIVIPPFLWLNNSLYGSPWLTGYTMPSTSVVTSDAPAVAVSVITKIASLVFPFGIHEMNILQNGWSYGFLLYPILTLLALLGIGLVFARWKQETATWRFLLIIGGLILAWLLVVYGSWKFNDNPDPLVLTIGNSYVRYWLPIFAIASVFVAKAVQWISDVPFPRVKIGISVAIMGVCIGASAFTVFGGTDGFLAIRTHLAESAQKKEAVLKATPSDAMIITDYGDKYLFPDRRVVVPLRSDATYAMLRNLVDAAPVYYFGLTLPDGDVDYLNTTILGPQGIILDRSITILDETLYKLRDMR